MSVRKREYAAIAFDLLESELFGHEKGVFTGAIAQNIGRFEMAHTGTLFLDAARVAASKLLRVLQEQEFERLGSGRTHRINVRMVGGNTSRFDRNGCTKKLPQRSVLPPQRISHSPLPPPDFLRCYKSAARDSFLSLIPRCCPYQCPSVSSAVFWSDRFILFANRKCVTQRHIILTLRFSRRPPTNLKFDQRVKQLDANARVRILSNNRSRFASAEQSLKELGIKLPKPPEPFGAYVEAVQTGNLLFLCGMLPTEGTARSSRGAWERSSM